MEQSRAGARIINQRTVESSAFTQDPFPRRKTEAMETVAPKLGPHPPRRCWRPCRQHGVSSASVPTDTLSLDVPQQILAQYDGGELAIDGVWRRQHHDPEIALCEVATRALRRPRTSFCSGWSRPPGPDRGHRCVPLRVPIRTACLRSDPQGTKGERTIFGVGAGVQTGRRVVVLSHSNSFFFFVLGWDSLNMNM